MSSTIEIETAKDRPWLVMVHGMSQDHRYFGEQVEAFRSHYRILLIDLPGHGLSSEVEGPYGHTEFAAHVERILDDPRYDRVHYWGTHTGGTVGVLLGFRRPDMFRSLLLEAPSVPGENPQIVNGLIAGARQRARDESIDAALDFWWHESPWFDSMRSDPGPFRAVEHRSMVLEFGARPWTDKAPSVPVGDILPSRVRIPVLVYQGEHDHPEFFASAQDVCGLFPGARYELVPGLGGFPAWEDPNEINAMAAGFITSVDASFP